MTQDQGGQKSGKPKARKRPPVNPRETVRYAAANEGMVQLVGCQRCGAPILRGYVDSLMTSLDPHPLSAGEEAHLVVAGVPTFHIRKFGAGILATYRSRLHFVLELATRGRASTIVGEHRCQKR